MKSIFFSLIAIFCTVASAATTSGPKGAQLKDGWYFIKNPASGKYLQVSGATNGNSGGNVVISSGTKDDGQKWKVTNVGNGLVTFTTALGNYMIDVSGGENKNDANIQLYNAYGGDAQQFMILKTAEKDVYTIGTKVSYFDKALDIAQARTTDGTNVVQWTNEMKANQSWTFERADGEEDECWAEALGYPCCSDPNTAVVTTDSDGQWGIENDKWCGILGSEKDIPTLTPTINTETYYLYNAYMNQCIHSDGILGSPITLDNCDYTTYSLWDIPYTHNGNFHLKFNEKHCLMVIDDISLVLGECGKDGTTFYREGNYIMSPLYKNKCIGLDTGSTLVMSDCNEFDKTQIFFFNLWTEPPLES